MAWMYATGGTVKTIVFRHQGSPYYKLKSKLIAVSFCARFRHLQRQCLGCIASPRSVKKKKIETSLSCNQISLISNFQANKFHQLGDVLYDLLVLNKEAIVQYNNLMITSLRVAMSRGFLLFSGQYCAEIINWYVCSNGILFPFEAVVQ